MLYQTARWAGYSPVTRLPLTSWTVRIGESLLTRSAIRSGEPRMTSRIPGAGEYGFRPPILNPGARKARPMSTALTTPNSSSPVSISGMNVLDPVWGCTLRRAVPASLATLARPLATA